ncbi:MAG: nitroreductase [Nitrospiraceae bacterium]|nr:nitroreductase [Nitrospiraceae bacterium]
MDLLEGIYTRRSIRNYTNEPVMPEELRKIIEAGTMAPSGLNNQPWRFVTVRDREKLGRLAKLTKYSHVIAKAAACIVVFIDKNAMYNEVKDHQSMGACHQNMLLAAHALGLGAVWLGEILKSAKEVRELCGLPESLELMAVIALGHPAGSGGRADRKPVEEVLLKEI